jgi:hypothetical protein
LLRSHVEYSNILKISIEVGAIDCACHAKVDHQANRSGSEFFGGASFIFFCWPCSCAHFAVTAQCSSYKHTEKFSRALLRQESYI